MKDVNKVTKHRYGIDHALSSPSLSFPERLDLVWYVSPDRDDLLPSGNSFNNSTCDSPSCFFLMTSDRKAATEPRPATELIAHALSNRFSTQYSLLPHQQTQEAKERMLARTARRAIDRLMSYPTRFVPSEASLRQD
jgi:hypothetical protein